MLTFLEERTLERQAEERAARPRFLTPEPEVIIDPGDAWAMDKDDGHFLRDDALWAAIEGRRIRLRFNDDFERGRWINRVGWTITEGKVISAMNTCAVQWTDNRAQTITVDVPIKHLLSAPPNKQGLECVTLGGRHLYRLCTVTKVNRKARKVDLQATWTNAEGKEESEKWTEAMSCVCWVEKSMGS